MNSTQHSKSHWLSRSQYATIQQAFSVLDIEGDGEISSGELNIFMQWLGHKQSGPELQEFIRNIDTRGKGTIHFKDFMSTLAPIVKEHASDCDIRKTFRVFDRDNDGIISPNELLFVMDILGQRLIEEQLKAMMKELDFDGDDRDFRKFIKLKEEIY